MVRKLFLCLFSLALPLIAELPPGVTRIPYGVTGGDRLAVTADGSFWTTPLPFTSGRVARVIPDGMAARVETRDAIGAAWGATTGPDGAYWVGDVNGLIARFDPASNAVERFTFPMGIGNHARFLRSGPDGNLWFTMSNTRAVRMRTDGMIVSNVAVAPHDGNIYGAAIGSDGAGYYLIGNALVRLTVEGERTEVPSTLKTYLFAGKGFLWSGVSLMREPYIDPPKGQIAKLGFDGEILATFNLPMTPMVSDNEGNLWLRELTPRGNVVARLSPAGVLTRFEPIPSLPSSPCNEPYYGGMTTFSDGRLAMSDFYPNIPRSLIAPSPCWPRTAEYQNTITIIDPRVLPVESIDPLIPTSKRRTGRH
jgi:sugar lactone lactonase YvrE